MMSIARLHNDNDSPTRMNRRHSHGQVRMGFYCYSLFSVILEHKQHCVNIVNLASEYMKEHIFELRRKIRRYVLR